MVILETQISQVAQQQATQATLEGSFLGQPQPNPKVHANSISMRSETTYEELVDPRLNTNSLRKLKLPKGNIVTTPEK